MTTRVWCELAWLGGDAPERGVLVEIDGGLIVSVTGDVRDCPEDAVRRAGITLPGFVNAHSHVFHRALRGRTHRGGGSFWTWREQMYELAALLDPDALHELARATYAEMALAGVTTVCEFHYVHHDVGGRRYADPNAMGNALFAAAQEAGVRLVLIDACYLTGGIGRPLESVQLRFGDGTVEDWADRVSALSAGPGGEIAAAIHSVRALAPRDMKEVAQWAHDRAMSLHAHVSEQPAENGACLATYGMTPTELLEDAGALGSSFTAVHAIHLTDSDIARLHSSTVCLCPTTERDLADGIAPSGRLHDAGSALAVGSDSNAVIDLLEEARAIELDVRLATGDRGTHGAAELAGALTGGSVLATGAPADLVTIGIDTVRLAGTGTDDLLTGVIFAATASDVTDVMVAGRDVVRDAAHLSIDVVPELDRAVRAIWRER